MSHQLTAAKLSGEDHVDKVIFLAWDLADALNDLAEADRTSAEADAVRAAREFSARCVAQRMTDAETMAGALESAARFLREKMK